MIEVILREDIKTLGKAGRDGPGEAGLRPQLPAAARPRLRGHRGQQEADRRGDQGAGRPQAPPRSSEAEQAAATLSARDASRSPGKAGEEGKLFGSITAQDIADALGAPGPQVDRRRIELEHPIKSLGEHTVRVRLHPEVHAEVRVSVVAE